MFHLRTPPPPLPTPGGILSSSCLFSGVTMVTTCSTGGPHLAKWAFGTCLQANAPDLGWHLAVFSVCLAVYMCVFMYVLMCMWGEGLCLAESGPYRNDFCLAIFLFSFTGKKTQLSWSKEYRGVVVWPKAQLCLCPRWYLCYGIIYIWDRYLRNRFGPVVLLPLEIWRRVKYGDVLNIYVLTWNWSLEIP